MEKHIPFTAELIAPCGINCGTCMAYLREKRNRCNGCSTPDLNKTRTRTGCKIKNCEHLKESGSKLCSDCQLFPCARIRHIDKRYRTKYHTSLIQNLDTIRETGIEYFLAEEVKKWTCGSCGAILSVHREKCLKCGSEKSAGRFTGNNAMLT